MARKAKEHHCRPYMVKLARLAKKHLRGDFEIEEVEPVPTELVSDFFDSESDPRWTSAGKMSPTAVMWDAFLEGYYSWGTRVAFFKQFVLPQGMYWYAQLFEQMARMLSTYSEQNDDGEYADPGNLITTCYQNALEIYRVVDFSHRAERDEHLRTCYWHLGIHLRSLGHHDLALHYLKQAVEIEDSFKDEFEAELYSDLCYAYDLLGDKENALVHAMRAITLSEQSRRSGYAFFVYARHAFDKQAFALGMLAYKSCLFSSPCHPKRYSVFQYREHLKMIADLEEHFRGYGKERLVSQSGEQMIDTRASELYDTTMHEDLLQERGIINGATEELWIRRRLAEEKERQLAEEFASVDRRLQETASMWLRVYTEHHPIVERMNIFLRMFGGVEVEDEALERFSTITKHFVNEKCGFTIRRNGERQLCVLGTGFDKSVGRKQIVVYEAANGLTIKRPESNYCIPKGLTLLDATTHLELRRLAKTKVLIGPPQLEVTSASSIGEEIARLEAEIQQKAATIEELKQQKRLTELRELAVAIFEEEWGDTDAPTGETLTAKFKAKAGAKLLGSAEQKLAKLKHIVALVNTFRADAEHHVQFRGHKCRAEMDGSKIRLVHPGGERDKIGATMKWPDLTFAN